MDSVYCFHKTESEIHYFKSGQEMIKSVCLINRTNLNLGVCLFSVLFNNVDNLMLAKVWFGFRILYLIGAILNLYRFPLIRPVIWLPSIVALVMMGVNIIS